MKWQHGFVGIALVSLAGCFEPPSLIPVGPPGMELKRLPVLADSEEPQARGEVAPGAESIMPETPLSTEVSPPTKPGEKVTTKSGLEYTTLRPGDGPEIKPGQYATVHYIGKLENGHRFESSRESDSPIRFQVGAGKLIRGWDEGISGMKLHESRQLIIPSHLAYGASGKPPAIPPNSTLIFDVELLKIE
jgi:FKBP-type peptidyl-prolyl cis-trans isomerase